MEVFKEAVEADEAEIEAVLAPQVEMLKGAIERAKETGEDPNQLVRIFITGQLMSASQEARKAGMNELADALVCLPAAFRVMIKMGDGKEDYITPFARN